MNRSSHPFFPAPHTGVPSTDEMLKEEHEVAVLGTPQGSGPVMSTVVNIRSETVVPDHIVWSLFNTLFFNPCCLGFVAFAYSVKVGGCVGASPESVCEPPDVLCPDGHEGGESLCVCVSRS